MISQTRSLWKLLGWRWRAEKVSCTASGLDMRVKFTLSKSLSNILYLFSYHKKHILETGWHASETHYGIGRKH